MGTQAEAKGGRRTTQGSHGPQGDDRPYAPTLRCYASRHRIRFDAVRHLQLPGDECRTGNTGYRCRLSQPLPPRQGSRKGQAIDHRRVGGGKRACGVPEETRRERPR